MEDVELVGLRRDVTLAEQLQAEISDEEYEAKIAGLLERVYGQETAADERVRDIYAEAYRVLSRGDHYLLIMINRALGRRLRPRWAFWRS